MSSLATRMSTVSICAADRCGGAGGSSSRSSGEQRGDAAGGKGDDKNDETRGFHTLHFPQ